jgi:mycothiol synthase
MKLTLRPYQSPDDYWRIREFLRQVMSLNALRAPNWHVARFDYWRWHGVMNLGQGPLEDSVFIWEQSDGQIAAVLNPEEKSQAFLQVHPGCRTAELEADMIALAEERLATAGPDGHRDLSIWADSQDRLRHESLGRRGFRRADLPEQEEVTHRRSLDTPLPDAPPTAGYTIRSLGDGLELLERCYASGLGFHNNDIRVAVDNRNDPGWYRNIQTAPLYRRDLDIVAVAPDGALAAFCTVWFDDATRTAYFEPVATVPTHRRRGLARAVMVEGLRRLKRMGARLALVGGYSPAANALYASVMGPEHSKSAPWVKRW